MKKLCIDRMRASINRDGNLRFLIGVVGLRNLAIDNETIERLVFSKEGYRQPATAELKYQGNTRFVLSNLERATEQIEVPVRLTEDTYTNIMSGEDNILIEYEVLGEQ
ncbi:MAG: hypothetical protein ABIJ18_03940 [archaeon]